LSNPFSSSKDTLPIFLYFIRQSCTSLFVGRQKEYVKFRKK